MTLKQKHNKYDCAEIEDMVQRYLDSNLNDQEKLAFEEHLEYCLPCDKKIEFEKKLKALLKNKISCTQIPNSLQFKLENLFKNVG